MQGLTDQLLNFVVRHERADLEEARESLVKQMSSDRSLLQQLEDTLLSELSNATGNILDNMVSASIQLLHKFTNGHASLLLTSAAC